jgi:cellulose biosynthesis protein BcsQ
MYVITFYSFKGGVGRTSALVNAGVHLAMMGKSVLLVDFDLEAPGLDAFHEFRADRTSPGLVEFVADYIRTGVAPLASKYISIRDIEGVTSGKLAIMRSGVLDRSYSARLRGLDWQKLYSEQDGFLLFEDLKEQWRQQLKPDYVLIDSRTGHTDIGGICTRQLPDSVAICLTPNEENISGLETVVADIRAESRDPDGRSIDVHFVFSNVPYIDDENRIIEKSLKEAKKRLTFRQPSAIIHRYESLSLLDNEIFVQKRKGSRLADEYRQLATAITNPNTEDRDVVLRRLGESAELSTYLAAVDQSLSTTMERIQALHGKDPEVLHSASRIAKRLGHDDEASLLFDRARLLGFRSAETILDTAQEQLRCNDVPAAVMSISLALSDSTADYFSASRAIELCLMTDRESLKIIGESTAFRKLKVSEQVSLCSQMLVRRDVLPIATIILQSIMERAGELSESESQSLRTQISACLIGQGRLGEAAAIVSRRKPDPAAMNISEAFNYGVAEWGRTETPSCVFFRRAVELGTYFESSVAGKNLWQCLSISAWVIGDLETANRYWRRSAELAADDPAHTFSGWRYLRISAAQFREDLEELRTMLSQNAVKPQILQEYWTQRT